MRPGRVLVEITTHDEARIPTLLSVISRLEGIMTVSLLERRTIAHRVTAAEGPTAPTAGPASGNGGT